MPRKLLSALALCSLALTACGGGGGGGSSTPPVVTATPTPPPVSPGSTSADCPTSGSVPASAAVGGASSSQSASRAASPAGGLHTVPGLLVVTYSASASHSAVDRIAMQYSAHAGPELSFEATGVRAATVYVDPSRADSAMTQLRAMPGVTHVEQAQYRSRLSTVTPNDPYYRGFGAGAPYYETKSAPGQWDMHVLNLDSAWGDFSSLPIVGAPIAIVDTGVDVTHPELKGGKIIRTECFVTYPSSSAQTTSTFATDTDGHGTNVAGIADSDTNNSFGFAGVAYDAPMLAYRIFPTTPSGGCEGSTNPQCESTDVDEVSAINDAVAHGAKVINLSLGAPGPLSTCKDTVEENAIENAIAQGVVVVAAAGNDGTSYLGCPAAYPGVIAVGASGLDDSNSSIVETVASYSNYTSSGAQSGGGAYLVAPGGTSTNSTDTDQLHWIGNITSSQTSSSSQYCGNDFAGETGDCQALFTGTSQATPHVTGVVSLMRAIKPALTPAQIASDLCSTAHPIGNSKQGCGRLDAAAAVALAASQ